MANADNTTTAKTEMLGFQPVIDSVITTLLKAPLGTSNDMFQVLDACQSYVNELIESNDVTVRMALCGRLLAGLEVLKSVLKEPLPAHLIEQLTIEDETFEDYDRPLCEDSDTLCAYCEGLTIVLLNQQVSKERQQQITDLLYELVNLLNEDLKTPRFILTPAGLAMVHSKGSSEIH